MLLQYTITQIGCLIMNEELDTVAIKTYTLIMNNNNRVMALVEIGSYSVHFHTTFLLVLCKTFACLTCRPTMEVMNIFCDPLKYHASVTLVHGFCIPGSHRPLNRNLQHNDIPQKLYMQCVCSLVYGQ